MCATLIVVGDVVQTFQISFQNSNNVTLAQIMFDVHGEIT